MLEEVFYLDQVVNGLFFVGVDRTCWLYLIVLMGTM